MCSGAEDVNGDGVCDVSDCQGGQTGEIEGTIDFCGEDDPDDGILVYIPGESFMVKTGPSGEFVLRSVPPGSYDLIVEIPGEEPFTISSVEVQGGQGTELKPISYCYKAYYTASDDFGQAALETVRSILIDGTVNTSYTNLGTGYLAESIGVNLGRSRFVSKIRMYGDTDAWSNFSVLYNTDNNNYGWTEVDIDVTKDREPGGLGGKYTNELSFEPVSAQWWKVWGAASGSHGVISVYEFEAW